MPSSSPLLLGVTLVALLAAAFGQDCPTPPVVSHTSLAAACLAAPASSAIGCSMYALCNDDSLTPPIFSALCDNWRIASSLCSDDAAVMASASGLCGELKAAYATDAQFKSCLRPYGGIRSTAAITAAHIGACDQMEGSEEPMGGCDACTSSDCPNPLASYGDGCIDMDMGQCAAWKTFCGGDAAPKGAAAAVLCLRAGARAGITAPPLPPSPPPPSPPTAASSPPPAAGGSSPEMGSGPMPSGHGSMPGMSGSGPTPPAAPCVADGTLPACASFTYPHASAVADLDNLCKAMPYMPGCTVRTACTAGLVTGDFCRPFTLVATICLEMPGMAGCRSYRTLCKNGTVVAQCRIRPAIPGTPSTRDGQNFIDALCGGSPAPALCDTCNQLSCDDYLGAVVATCSATPPPTAAAVAAGCAASYEGWCSGLTAWQGRGNALAPDAITNSTIAHFCGGSKAFAALAPAPAPAPKPTPVPVPGSGNGSVKRSPPVKATKRMPPPTRRPPPRNKMLVVEMQ